MNLRVDPELGGLIALTRYHEDYSSAVRRVRLIAALVTLATLVIIPLELWPRMYRPFALVAIPHRKPPAR
jgi:hypothetical protein